MPLDQWSPQLFTVHPQHSSQPCHVPREVCKILIFSVCFAPSTLGCLLKFACYAAIYGLELKEEKMHLMHSMFCTLLCDVDELQCELHQGFGLYPL